MIDKSLALAALKKWGKERQTNMAIEETAEFITAWNHHKRGRITEREYVGEIVDAYVMLSQLRVMYGDLFEEIFHEKLADVYRKINAPSNETTDAVKIIHKRYARKNIEELVGSDRRKKEELNKVNREFTDKLAEVLGEDTEDE